MKKILFLFLLARFIFANSNQEYLVGATLWMQQSGEFKALSLQSYNLAKQKLDAALQTNHERPIAIITDIDETVLDNSPFMAKGIIEHTKYPEGWIDWTNLSKAYALPGAINFLKYVDSLGVEIFFITNRETKEKASTLLNLEQLGIPVKEDHLMMKAVASSSKKTRRDFVRSKFEVVLYLGDNLDDFSDEFEKASVKERKDLAEKMEKKWGAEFVIFPNPTYGSWEGAIYNYKYNQTDEALDRIRKSSLIQPLQISVKNIALSKGIVYKAL